MRAASQLPGRGPTYVDDASAPYNQKSNDDIMMMVGNNISDVKQGLDRFGPPILSNPLCNALSVHWLC